MYLVDTNIFIEGLLAQEKAKDVRAFFRNVSLSKIFMTDLSLHSIGIILFRLKKIDLFMTFINDMIVDGIEVLSLSHDDMKELGRISQQYNLDFDDTYQYVIAEKHGLQLISFDKDFDMLPSKRKEPSAIL